MERPSAINWRRTAGALALFAAASAGCRSTKSEVPPGRPYSRVGDVDSSLGFSSQPHPAVAGAMPNPGNQGPGGLFDDRPATSNPSVLGTPTASDRVAMPTGNRYGAPGSSGVDETAGATPADLAKSLMSSGDTTSKMLKRDPNASPTSGFTP